MFNMVTIMQANNKVARMLYTFPSEDAVHICILVCQKVHWVKNYPCYADVCAFFIHADEGYYSSGICVGMLSEHTNFITPNDTIE